MLFLEYKQTIIRDIGVIGYRSGAFHLIQLSTPKLNIYLFIYSLEDQLLNLITLKN
jgi:hypothetical protein